MQVTKLPIKKNNCFIRVNKIQKSTTFICERYETAFQTINKTRYKSSNYVHKNSDM